MTDAVVYLVRHGETDWNNERRCQGHTDIPLNETGLFQAERLGDYFNRLRLHAVYSSDLTRARQTAEKVARYHRLEVHALPKLRERSYGEWEGLTVAEIRERYPDHVSVRLKGGQFGIEPFTDFKKRIVSQLNEIAKRHLGETVLVVSHGGSINAFLHAVTDGRLGTGITSLENTSVTKTVYRNKTGWDVRTVNETAHLRLPH